MKPTRVLLAIFVIVALVACTDDTTPDSSTSSTTTKDPGSATTIPDNSTTLTSPPPTGPPRPPLSEVEDALVSQIPDSWSAPSVSRAPFSVSLCGRTVTVVEADPTDESPNRPREGFILTTTAPGDTSVSVVVYEQFAEDTMENIETALPQCGPSTLTNPTDGWTLTTDANAESTTIANVPGALVSSFATRVYTDNRTTRYSATRLFFGTSNGFLLRVSVSASGTDRDEVEAIDGLFEEVVEMTRLATDG